MKTAVDNITLINTFLKGEDSLLANRELRIEKVRDETQLLTTQGILLAKGRLKQRLPQVVVRLQSDYWQIIHELALKASFIPQNIQQERAAGEKFAQYAHLSVPAGYQVHCQEASALWKTWWINHRRLQLMDMLLLCGNRWYPINQMMCETGTIYIKTWRGEKIFSIADTIIWIDRNTHGQPKGLKPKKHLPNVKRAATQHPHHANRSAVRPDIPNVPDDLRKVVKASGNRLIVHTVLGPVVIEGQNLTCTLGRKVSTAS
ncbi:MAG: hypothetical protein F6K11_08460 [Leptolyngbya sp. SIO3F4]|nr:hypothetical protein [Leptolyngbya sp. SIO3F4]